MYDPKHSSGKSFNILNVSNVSLFSLFSLIFFDNKFLFDLILFIKNFIFLDSFHFSKSLKPLKSKIELIKFLCCKEF